MSCIGTNHPDKSTRELQLSDANTFCTTASAVLPCNLALPWSSNVTSPSATAACPSASPAQCRLSQAWGASSLTSNHSSRFPPGSLPVPLDVNTSVFPAKSYVLAAAACRYSDAAGSSSGWLAAEDLSQGCISQTTPTGAQWRALLLAGWISGFANATACGQCLCSAVMVMDPAVWWDALDAGPHRGGLRAPDGSAPCTGQVSWKQSRNQLLCHTCAHAWQCFRGRGMLLVERGVIGQLVHECRKRPILRLAW